MTREAEEPLRILLVDDEEDFLEATSKRLRRRGFEVRTATRCEQALRSVAERWPGVVVLDVMLPDTNGIECLRRLRRAAPRLPVVMLTARIERRPVPFLRERLVVLGYLLIHTRQIDMVMDGQAFVERYRERIRSDIRTIRERLATEAR